MNKLSRVVNGLFQSKFHRTALALKSNQIFETMAAGGLADFVFFYTAEALSYPHVEPVVQFLCHVWIRRKDRQHEKNNGRAKTTSKTEHVHCVIRRDALHFFKMTL